jgi:hypothetical protein
MLPRRQPARRSASKNRALPYRVILKNVNYEPKPSKRMHRLSASRLRQHPLAKPTVASSLFKSRVLNPMHLNQVNKDNNALSKDKEPDSGFQVVKEDSMLYHSEKSMEKHRMKKKNENDYQYGCQYDRHYHHGAQQQHKRGSEPQSSKSAVKTITALDSLSSSSDDNSTSSQYIKSKVSYPLPCHRTTAHSIQLQKKPPPIPPKPQQILVTKNKTLNTKPDIAARTKDLRLKGSDLYVARLGNCNFTPPIKPRPKVPEPSPEPTSSPKAEPASLYDELSPLSRSVSPPSTFSKPIPLTTQPEIRASRPCYRCVAAMHSVGIKRVFWTNQDGEWEGAKIRDLVEALETGIEGDDGDGVGTGQENKGVFVTKHEVLMLKRIMGL